MLQNFVFYCETMLWLCLGIKPQEKLMFWLKIPGFVAINLAADVLTFCQNISFCHQRQDWTFSNCLLENNQRSHTLKCGKAMVTYQNDQVVLHRQMLKRRVGLSHYLKHNLLYCLFYSECNEYKLEVAIETIMACNKS